MQIFREGSDRGARRGVALVMMVLCVVTLAGLCAALLCVNLGQAREQRGERQEIHASYVCQAGLSQAMYQLQRGQSGNVGTQSSPATWGSAHYWVQATNVTSDTVRLTATGLDDRSGASEELVVRAQPSTIWRYGMFGKESLHLDSNARADSYDSSLGTYAAQAVNGSGSSLHALSDGDVGSNGSITLDSNAKVWGDAVAGPSHTTVLHDNASVTGSTTPATQQMQLPAVNVPTYTNYSGLNVLNNTTIPSGNRAYTSVVVKNNKTLTITGPANIVMSNLNLNSAAKIVANVAAGPVTIYVIDNYIMDSNTEIYPSNYHPADLSLNLLSDNVINPEVNVQLDTLSISSNSLIHGLVYAPNARVRLDSNFNLYGSLIARSLDVDSNSFFHFDEALLSGTGSGTTLYETLSWREIPFQK